MTRPKPTEIKRAQGNRGKRKLPTPPATAALRVPTSLAKPPTAPETLGPTGLEVWGRVWTYAREWLAPTDYDVVALYAAGHDEQAMIRAHLEADPDDFHARAALRALGAELIRLAGVLYLTPTDRGRSGGPADPRAEAARLRTAELLSRNPRKTQ